MENDMADAYGTIVVGMSNDFEGDLQKITEYLNELQLHNGDSAFKVNDGKIWLNGAAQYPTVLPTRHKIVSIMIDGEEVQKHINELKDDEWEDIFDYIEDEQIDLFEITNQLSSHITSGTLYVSCCANEKNRGLESGTLEVTSDGKGKRMYVSHWVGGEIKMVTETC